jgi:exonuclease V gamma subunit
VRAHLTETLAARGVAVPEPHALAELLSTSSLPRLRSALRLGAAADLVGATAGIDLTISLTALRRFLETPAQAWAQVVLRLDDLEAEDLIEREDEPFRTPSHERAVFLRDVFARHLGASGAPPISIDDALTAVTRARVLSGRAPVGVFGEVEHDRHRELLEEWSREVAKRGGAEITSWRRIGFGKSAGAGCERHDPIVLDVRGRRVELVGWTEIIGGAIGSIILQPGKADERHTLRGAFDAAILAATGVAHAHAHLVLDRKGAYAATHKPWASSDAKAWLRELVDELLHGTHAYLLSLKMVDQIRHGRRPTIETPSDQTPGSLGFGPLRHADELRIPDDAAAIVARRHAPIFDRMTGDEP